MADPTTTPAGGVDGGSDWLAPGQVLAGHEIRFEAGRGGMGVVYAALHLRLRVVRALKVLDARAASNPVFRARFELESQLAASLDHPNVIQVYEAGESGGRLYLSMRFVDGPSLAQLLASEGPLPFETTIELISQLGSALDEAHAHGLVHRDVKPANVLLSTERPRRAFLGDFGISRLLAGGRELTQTGETLGTVDYVAPEQIAGETVGTETDVYSLACVAYEALAGTPPFARSTQLATMFAHANDPRPDVARVRRGLPPAVSEVLARGLAVDPGDRYASASDLAEDLGRAAAGRTTATRREAPRPAWRRWWVLGAAALAAAGAVAALALLVGTGDNAPNREQAPVADPTAPVSVKTIEVAPTPTRIAVGELNVWTASGPGRAITAIVPALSEIARPPVTVEGRPAAIAVAFGSIWVADRDGKSLLRLDPGEGTVPVRIPVGRSPSDIAVSASHLWVTNRAAESVSRVNPETNAVDATIPVPAADAVSIGEGGVWLGGDRGIVTELDPASGRPRGEPVSVGVHATDIAAGEAGVWVLNRHDGTLFRIAPGSREVSEPVDVGDSPSSLTTGFGYVWVALDDGTVIRVDPATLELVGEPTAVGSRPTAITAGKGFVWTANEGDSSVTRIQPR